MGLSMNSGACAMIATGVVAMLIGGASPAVSQIAKPNLSTNSGKVVAAALSNEAEQRIAGDEAKIKKLEAKIAEYDARLASIETKYAVFKEKYKHHQHVVLEKNKTSAPDICFNNFGCGNDDW